MIFRIILVILGNYCSGIFIFFHFIYLHLFKRWHIIRLCCLITCVVLIKFVVTSAVFLSATDVIIWSSQVLVIINHKWCLDSLVFSFKVFNFIWRSYCLLHILQCRFLASTLLCATSFLFLFIFLSWHNTLLILLDEVLYSFTFIIYRAITIKFFNNIFISKLNLLICPYQIII